MKHIFEVRLTNTSPNAKPKDFFSNRQSIEAGNWKQAVRQAIRFITKSGRWQSIRIEVNRFRKLEV